MNGCGAHHPLARSGQVHTKKIRLPSCFTPKDFHPWPSGWRRRLRCPESFVGSITKGCKLFISWDRTEAVKGVGWNLSKLMCLLIQNRFKRGVVLNRIPYISLVLNLEFILYFLLINFFSLDKPMEILCNAFLSLKVIPWFQSYDPGSKGQWSYLFCNCNDLIINLIFSIWTKFKRPLLLPYNLILFIKPHNECFSKNKHEYNIVGHRRWEILKRVGCNGDKLYQGRNARDSSHAKNLTRIESKWILRRVKFS